MEFRYSCPECKGTNVSQLQSLWVNPNNGEYVGDGPEQDNDEYCDDCEKHVNLVREEIESG